MNLLNNIIDMLIRIYKYINANLIQTECVLKLDAT